MADDTFADELMVSACVADKFLLGFERLADETAVKTAVAIGLKLPDSDQWVLFYADDNLAMTIGQELIEKAKKLLAAQMEDS